MISNRTFTFLKGIAAHNDKAWLEDHRDDYQTAKDNIAEAVATLISRSDEFDDAVGRANSDPARCVSRLNRDMRFAKGKPPYKTDFFISLGLGELQATASYFVHVEPGHCYAGGGIFTTQPGALGRIRDRIVAQTGKWNGIVHTPAFQKVFPNGLISPETLKTVPHGYDPDHPAIEDLRRKGFCANHPLTDKTMQTDEAFDQIVQAFRAARPLVEFINTAVHG